MRGELLEVCEASRQDPSKNLPPPDFQFESVKVNNPKQARLATSVKYIKTQ